MTEQIFQAPDVTGREIQVVRAGLSHTEEILKLLEEAALWMQSHGIDQWKPGQFSSEEVAGCLAEREVYTALCGGEIAGLFTLQFSDPLYWGEKNDESFAYLHRLTVAPAFRGTGLGRHLVDFATRRAQEAGCTGLRLDTVAFNLKLNRHYQRMGFRYMGTNDMGNGRMVNLYERSRAAKDEGEIFLTFFSEKDFDDLRRWSVSPAFLKQWAGPSLTYPLDEQQLAKYLAGANHMTESERLIFTAVDSTTGQVVGHISFSIIDRENQSGRIGRVVVDPELQGRGYGSRMLREIMRIGFEALGLHRLSLGVFDFNTAARRTYEKAGFIREGVQRESAWFDGKVVDCIEMSMLNREWRARRLS